MSGVIGQRFALEEGPEAIRQMVLSLSVTTLGTVALLAILAPALKSARIDPAGALASSD